MMRAAWYLALAAMLATAGAACRGSSYTDPRPAAAARSGPALGGYEYVASLPDGTQLQGVFAILRDTVIVESNQGLCKAVAYDPRRSRWLCNGVGRYSAVSLEIDRFSPGQQSRWRLTETIRRQRRVCVAYVRTPTGQRTNQCARWEIENYDQPQSRSGIVRIRPRAATDTLGAAIGNS